jgi:hypothetical protein
MTDPTQLPSEPMTPAQLAALLEARRAAWLDEVNALIAAAVAPLEAALDEALKVGDAISLKMAEGSFLSADDGGPREPDLPVSFSSKASVHAWESFEVGKG